MDFGEILFDAWDYTKEGVIKNPVRWMQLIVAVLCLGIPYYGYTVRVYRGEKTAPEVENWGTLFIEGLKVYFITLGYILPFIIALLIIFAVALLAVVTNTPDTFGILIGILDAVFQMLVWLLQFVAIAFLPIAYIRFARTGIVGEAFNFGAMLETIGKIGWLNYAVAMVLVALVISLPLGILLFVFLFILILVFVVFSNNIILLIGAIAVMIIMLLIILPVIGIFQARYVTRVYESAGNTIS